MRHSKTHTLNCLCCPLISNILVVYVVRDSKVGIDIGFVDTSDEGEDFPILGFVDQSELHEYGSITRLVAIANDRMAYIVINADGEDLRSYTVTTRYFRGRMIGDRLVLMNAVVRDTGERLRPALCMFVNTLNITSRRRCRLTLSGRRTYLWTGPSPSKRWLIVDVSISGQRLGGNVFGPAASRLSIVRVTYETNLLRLGIRVAVKDNPPGSGCDIRNGMWRANLQWRR